MLFAMLAVFGKIITLKSIHDYIEYGMVIRTHTDMNTTDRSDNTTCSIGVGTGTACTSMYCTQCTQEHVTS